MGKRFEVHSHTDYSNIRLLDCINKPEKLIEYAQEIGLAGIAVTDHDCLSSHVELNQIAQELNEKGKDFKIALGNEIYLTETRDSNQKYYHFVLIAKNKEGHRALRELSSRAWLNSYYDRGMERVVTLYDDLKEITSKYPNSLIATTACLGGELSTLIMQLSQAERLGDEQTRVETHNRIVEFVLFCKELFGDDFYFEIAPGQSDEQIIVNKRMVALSEAFDVKMVIGSDAHYLKKEDRFVHKSYLNSKGGEREVDSFYEYSYLQTDEEVRENLSASGYSDDFINEMYNNSMEIESKIEKYSILHKPVIPKVDVIDYSKKNWEDGEDYPILQEMLMSDDKIERYWINECLLALEEKGLYKKEYLDRLEEEADIQKVIGEALETNMFAYPVTLQHYVSLFWDSGSMVGAGRGSSCSGLNHYLLGITQLDPIKWDLPYWRYLNKSRFELGDIDIDLCPSKRPLIIQKIKEERGANFNSDIDKVTKENCGCSLIATFGTEGTRSTVLTACRGYRSEDYPDGIDNDTASYISSLIPQERGFLWSLSDVINGNEEKGRRPNQIFIKEVKQFPGLIDIMTAIEGLRNKRSSHASGVIMFDEDPYEFGCFMRTPKGEVITQYDLHTCEAAGMVKYDLLVTDVQDKLTEAIRLLQEAGEIEPSLTLKEVYDKYFHPEVLPIDDQRCWDALRDNNVINIFQFESEVGSQAAKKIAPQNIIEMSDANGLMRLMTSEKGEELPMEKYIRYKEDMSLWVREMELYGLTKKEQKIVRPYFEPSYGVPPSQEQLMQMLMDKDICNFTLAEANAARKIVGKKQMDKIPMLRDKINEQATSPCIASYIWDCGVGPQMGYSFSRIHALAYSFIGYQTIYIATNWNPIYWNTACLTVNSGSLEEDGKSKKAVATDYAKMAKAIGEITSQNVKISLVDINKSKYSFQPDVENNAILFGMKGLNRVGDDVIEQIIEGRPYTGIKDFMLRCPQGKLVMVSLIKSGAFDRLDKEWALKMNKEPRLAIMGYYISKIYGEKKRLNLQNFNGLMQKGLIPDELNFQVKTFEFNKFLKAHCKKGNNYILIDNTFMFYEQFFNMDLVSVEDGVGYINQKEWDKQYQLVMDSARDYIKDNQKQMLKKFNSILFKEMWDKYAEGTVSSWEMDSMCFYYNEHELAHVDNVKYGIVNFNDLDPVSDINYFFKRGGKQIPIYTIYRIIGTVISKDDNRSSISLLTTDGVVNVKFTKDYYAMASRQISETQDNGTKKIVEKGWFTRGTKLMVSGYRRDDTFVGKTYKSTGGHQLYKIVNVHDNGDIELVHTRYGMED